jgi:hypothetical protein
MTSNRNAFKNSSRFFLVKYHGTLRCTKLELPTLLREPSK